MHKSIEQVPTLHELREIKEKINELMIKVDWLIDAYEEMKIYFEAIPIDTSVVELKETTPEDAKKMILEYYEAHKDEVIYPDDVADELGIDLKIAMEATVELIKEGRLEVVE
ncbi:MAG: hypothetical protein ACE5KT_01620 [Methanosarcinales archaeon]